ncbi:MAG: hypothetical protein LIP09_08970 [Bacteroidales bacterium]|nr:hypothetical protein [Bacteroidales bacterium]
MQRILAHKIIYEGREYPLSIAEISPDGRSVTITPFLKETPATTFHSGIIELYHDESGKIKIIRK